MAEHVDEQGRARVVVTGTGVISPMGHTTDESWDSMIEGRSGIGPITQFDASELPVRIAGEVKDFDPGKYMNPKEARRIARISQLAIAATKMALENAGLELPLRNAERTGTVIGTAAGGLDVAVDQMETWRSKGLRSVSPFAIAGFLPNMPAHHVSLMAGTKGLINTVIAACASGAQAIGEAVDYVRHGRADVVIAGGVEGLIHEAPFVGFSRMQALSTRNDEPDRASRPFDKDRDGFVMSEGAGIVILERLDQALARGARIIAEVLGYASSSDAFHIASPDPESAGAIRAMRWSIEDARVPLDEIEYINAHGTSTLMNDARETFAIKKLFGDRAYNIPVSSNKSLLGHTFGAAGAIEAIFSMYSLVKGLIPPTWNYETPDPECDLDYVPNEPRDAHLNVVLSNSFGMGGQNACLVIRKP